ncbi:MULTISPECIES: Imm74 family immunity protein [Stenotrophomonas]|uniref:Imm74 family immunity protein n=1 Tax=Stenotrophomonas TaxID=40323 RepID=UPI0008723DF2|nr:MULTISPECIES: Imm74 family immunity protein [Stenotrophomonas]OEY99051.1 hypothetical protein BIY45_18975 [Stenotrophomonas sp. BIIR7]
MIREVTRGCIKVAMEEKTATIPGEMFFPENGNLGFTLFLDQVGCWDPPHEDVEIGKDEVDHIVAGIRADFEKGGHVLNIA